MIMGWDIGGAHVKAACVDENGEVVTVLQTACPLWRGIDQLTLALERLSPCFPKEVACHAVTMTGELVDCFASREAGIHAIVGALSALLGSETLRVFAGVQGFVAPDRITGEHIMQIASANWLASITLAAKQCRNALFVDIGSTTTDILCIEHHRPSILGYTDYERLRSGELFYTGSVRTSVMAVARQAMFKGESMHLMAEHFATMADVYRLTGDLQEAHDQSETADCGPKTVSASALRLSRLTGYEFDDGDLPLWRAFAHQLKNQQMEQVRQACERQIERLPSEDVFTVVGAGVGRFLVRDIAAAWNARYIDFNDLCPARLVDDAIQPADCAPAVAVAFLARGIG